MYLQVFSGKESAIVVPPQLKVLAFSILTQPSNIIRVWKHFQNPQELNSSSSIFQAQLPTPLVPSKCPLKYVKNHSSVTLLFLTTPSPLRALRQLLYAAVLLVDVQRRAVDRGSDGIESFVLSLQLSFSLQGEALQFL